VKIAIGFVQDQRLSTKPRVTGFPQVYQEPTRLRAKKKKLLTLRVQEPVT